MRLLAVLLAFILVCLPNVSMADGQAHPHRALLVAGGKYRCPALKGVSLKAPEQDVRLMVRLLLRRGWPASAIMVVGVHRNLLGKDIQYGKELATHDAITEGIAWLAKDEKRKDAEDLLYISSDGLQARTFQPGDPLGFSGGFLTADVKQGQCVFWEKDLYDELKNFLGKFTLIFDFCHAAGMAKDVHHAVRAKAIMVDLFPAPPAPRPKNEFLTSGRVNLVVACGAQEQALELHLPAESPGGEAIDVSAFTWFLYQNLYWRNSKWQDLIESTTENLREIGASQHPALLTGSPQDIAIPSGEGKTQWMIPIINDKQGIVLDGGKLEGITTGFSFLIDGEKTDFQIKAEWTYSNIDDKSKVRAGVFARPKSFALITAWKPLHIHIANQFPSKALEQALAGTSAIVSVGMSESDDLDQQVTVEVHPATDGTFAADVTSAIGKTTAAAPTERSLAAELAAIICRLQATTDLKTWINPIHPFGLRIVPDGRDNAVYRLHEHMQFRVQSENICYVTLVALQPDGHIVVIYPNLWSTNSRTVSHGQDLVLPGTEPFILSADPPAGMSILVAIATARPLTLPAMMLNTPEPGSRNVAAVKNGSERAFIKWLTVIPGVREEIAARPKDIGVHQAEISAVDIAKLVVRVEENP